MVEIRLKVEKKCESFLEKFLGLMLSRRAKTTLFSNFKGSKIKVHTFFVFFPIDVYWLNSDFRVVGWQTLSPFSFSGSLNAKYLLETEKGLLEAKIGDKLAFN